MPVHHEIEGSVSTVTIDRADAMNAFDEETVAALLDAVEAALEADGSDAVVLEGAGDRAFCTGADLARFREAIEAGDAVQIVSRVSGAMNDVILAIVEADKPVVACLNGTAAGGGLGLALACDLRIAADTARLTTAFSRVGVSPDGGTTWFLPQIVGMARAKELLLTSEVLDASDAEDEGLVTEVVPASRARERAREHAERLASGPSHALAGIKRHLADRKATLADHLEAEQEDTALSAETGDFEEGVEAFLDKRSPKFG